MDGIMKLPKQLIAKFKRLQTLKKVVTIVVIGLAAWWLWKNHLSAYCGAEGFDGVGGAGATGTGGDLQCTMYYVNWCPHCKTAKPEWEQLEGTFHGKNVNGNKVFITKIDCEEFPEVAKEQNISGYPSFKFSYNGQAVPYSGERTFGAFKSFIESVAYSNNQ